MPSWFLRSAPCVPTVHSRNSPFCFWIVCHVLSLKSRRGSPPVPSFSSSVSFGVRLPVPVWVKMGSSTHHRSYNKPSQVWVVPLDTRSFCRFPRQGFLPVSIVDSLIETQFSEARQACWKKQPGDFLRWDCTFERSHPSSSQVFPFRFHSSFVRCFLSVRYLFFHGVPSFQGCGPSANLQNFSPVTGSPPCRGAGAATVG